MRLLHLELANYHTSPRYRYRIISYDMVLYGIETNMHEDIVDKKSAKPMPYSNSRYVHYPTGIIWTKRFLMRCRICIMVDTFHHKWRCKQPLAGTSWRLTWPSVSWDFTSGTAPWWWSMWREWMTMYNHFISNPCNAMHTLWCICFWYSCVESGQSQ